MEHGVILVVDDEDALRSGLAEFLTTMGYQVRTASSGVQALEMMSGDSFDAVLLDVILPDVSGLDVLKRYRAASGKTPVVVLSALGGADDAVRALKLGATDYLTKPFARAELEDALRRAMGLPVAERAAPVVQPAVLERPVATELPRALEGSAVLAEPEDRFEMRPAVFISHAMRRAKAMVDRIADTDIPVLLLGESGVGKEVIAREIHRTSRRNGKPFIKINCAALPAELLESELFGHERGAFTGATAEKPGKFELADKGTIFLDEIGEMDIRLQAKLLQVLQDEDFFRVGGKKSVRVDARVVVATNRELDQEIARGNFREDLYYRLNVVAIKIAPLRDRREDILPLVEAFLRKYSRRYANGLSELPPDVLEAFQLYDWPGNVRELENMVRRLVVLKDPMLVLEELRAMRPGPALAEVIAPSPAAVPLAAANTVSEQPRYANPFSVPQPPPPPMTMLASEMSLKDIGKRAAMLAEREAILAMLQRTAWNKRKAAGKLRISYKALLYKIKESGIIDPRSNAEF